MADGAKKIVDAMKTILNTQQNTTSAIVSLKVKSIEPLIFENEHRLPIDENFYSLSKIEDWNQLNIGDVVRAFKMNNGQSYYIQESLKSANSSDNLKNLEETLITLANMVSDLTQEVEDLTQEVDMLKTRVTILEGKVG